MLRLRSTLLSAGAVVLAMAAARPASAHKGHHPSPSPSASPSSPVAAGESAATASPAAVSAPTAAVSPSPSPAAPVHVDWTAAAFEHMHNKLVHFPIALGLAAAVMLILGRRSERYAPAARALLTVAAVFGLAAYFTGGAQAAPFEGTPMWDVVGLHAKLGTSTGLLLILGAVLTRLRAAQRWLWLYAVVLLLAISATGLVGGVVAHGEM